MKRRPVEKYDGIYALILLLSWAIIKLALYSHFSQTEPCPTEYNTWQTDKLASDKAEGSLFR